MKLRETTRSPDNMLVVATIGAVIWALARSKPAAAMSRASDWLLFCSTELRSRRLKARKATATTVMTESMRSGILMREPGLSWHKSLSGAVDRNTLAEEVDAANLLFEVGLSASLAHIGQSAPVLESPGLQNAQLQVHISR